MKIIHGDGYTNEELISFKPTICDNLVHSMRAVLEAMGVNSVFMIHQRLIFLSGTLKINLGEQGNRVHVKAVLTYQELSNESSMPAELADAIKALWRDSGVQDCYRRANEYQLNDSAAYYFDAIERISAGNYVPTQQDGTYFIFDIFGAEISI